MPIILVPLPDPTLPVGVSPSTVVRADDLTHDDCPIVTKQRTLVAPKGRCSTLSWVMKDEDGDPLDLTDALTGGDPGQIIARFRLVGACTTEISQIIGVVTAPQTGEIYITLTDAMVQEAGIYEFSIAITDNGTDGNVIAIDQGYLFVERSLFGDVTNPGSGPLSISDIRLDLRDTMIENNLIGDVEYDDTEIIHAIIDPIREWNEAPPNVAMFTTQNFPFHNAWKDATVARLLRVAAHWYRRNKLQVNHGGMQDNDRDKDNPYMQASLVLQERWDLFVRNKKIEINVGLASGQLNSGYSSRSWY